MSIDDMRKAMQEFCWGVRCNCPGCPVVVIHGLCETYNWDNAPEDLVKKAYLLAFGEVKEGKTMNITADDIRKVALEMIGEMAQAAADNGERFTDGYILGVYDLADKLTEGKKDDD